MESSGIDLYAEKDGKVYAGIPYEELEGIDLSPELLEDFGFEEIAGSIMKVAPARPEKGEEALSLLRYNYRKTLVKDDVTYVVECLHEGGWTFQGIRLPMDPWHVHELQNLYYYLLNEELIPEYS